MLTFSNGGTLSYLGACFCECPPSFAGLDCSLEVPQVRASLPITDAHYVTFDRHALTLANTKQVSVLVNQVEMQHIKILDGGGADRRGVATQDLDVGFRVIGMETNMQVMRMITVLVKGMKNRNMNKILATLGLRLNSDKKYLVEPTPYMPRGQTACGYTPTDQELNCNDDKLQRFLHD